MDKTECTVCGSSSLSQHLDLGRQPPSNRFLAAQSALSAEVHYPLSLGMCETCGTIQLTDRMPIDAIRPRFDWLLYNEPEGHLDRMVEGLIRLEGIGEKSRFLGVTYKDQSTLDRLARLGFVNTCCIEPASLEIDETPFGLESIQRQLSNAGLTVTLANTYGLADLLMVRHIVEHAGNAKDMVKTLRKLVAPGGYMVLEVPDSERIFQNQNYPFLWEEHIAYFTESSIAQLARAAGAELVRVERYRYRFEDSLIGILKFPLDGAVVLPLSQTPLEQTRTLLENIECRFSVRAAAVRGELQALVGNGARLAVFGGGHLAVRVINFYGIADLIECVIDDHPQKANMRMPGSSLPIEPSGKLAELGITHCLSTLSPESEAKVRVKLTGYFERGGQFIPAFSSDGAA